MAPTAKMAPTDDGPVLRLLATGHIGLEALVPGASYITLYCRVSPRRGRGPRDGAACVYKPIRGESPLWDFPDGTLAHREVAAYLVSTASGWNVVPPTVLRGGPLGPGMVQLWVEPDETVDLLELFQSDHPALRRMALFDHVVNNADRKIGHLLPVPGGHVYGIDHGVCFAEEPTLRSVLWAWRGEPFTTEEVGVLSRLRGALDDELGRDLGAHLSAGEIAATAARIDRLLAGGTFPQPDPDRRAIPWPPV